MRFKRLLKDAGKSLRKNKSRSLLTALGIIIGVASVIVMVGIGKGATQDIEKSIKSMGSNMMMIFPGSSHRGGISRGAGSINRFTLEDVEMLREETKSISHISPMVRTGAQVIGAGNNWNTMIEGVSPEYQDIRSWFVEDGSFFTDRDLTSRRKVAVIGRTVADELFGEDSSPIGERIRIGKQPFTVIGVMEEKGDDPRGRDQDDAILMPATTALYRLKGGTNIDMIYASASSTELMDSAEVEMTAIMREAHDLAPGVEDDFRILTQAEIIDFASGTARTMTILLGAIAMVSLIVGGIGIMNIMLVSVTERTREIGIRMALGARNSDIMAQFLFEATFLSLLGGFIGITLAIAIIFAFDRFSGMSAVVNPLIVMLSAIFSGAVGIFFGWWPAKKAAGLNPIDALRYE